MHNLSFENEFYLHKNEKSFPYQRLSTFPHFDTESLHARLSFVFPMKVPGEFDPLSSHKLCVNMYVKKAKFESNSSVDDLH